MGKIISKDLLRGGFKYRYNDGKVEHFMPKLFGDYKGDDGSVVTKKFLGGYQVKRRDGYKENFEI
ncbi:hypothetical protein [Streptococcus loxodontisalivarius]|uniref:HNH endonuclease n=1 Tax=Streptococcus loxodontisalivarius TaxID=1349415 RepID=A0ABS2PPB3_9STRE|nr:hypothetical protein [Streptococcus loxodontisalivarius]MBM7641783.1 hypothetical protein [Streptococcus loxodontisalivarius]